jgi:hypothetical protein
MLIINTTITEWIIYALVIAGSVAIGINIGGNK